MVPGVFGGEKNFGNGFEFLRAPEVATTVDDEKNHNARNSSYCVFLCTLKQRSENWYLGVFGGEKNFENGFEILRAPEVAATDDNEKNQKQGIPLIAFSYVR